MLSRTTYEHYHIETFFHVCHNKCFHVNRLYWQSPILCTTTTIISITYTFPARHISFTDMFMSARWQSRVRLYVIWYASSLWSAIYWEPRYSVFTLSVGSVHSKPRVPTIPTLSSLAAVTKLASQKPSVLSGIYTGSDLDHHWPCRWPSISKNSVDIFQMANEVSWNLLKNQCLNLHLHLIILGVISNCN